jgi:hypothetical protein
LAISGCSQRASAAQGDKLGLCRALNEHGPMTPGELDRAVPLPRPAAGPGRFASPPLAGGTPYQTTPDPTKSWAGRILTSDTSTFTGRTRHGNRAPSSVDFRKARRPPGAKLPNESDGLVCRGALSPIRTTQSMAGMRIPLLSSTPSRSSRCTNRSAVSDAKRTLRTVSGWLHLLGDWALAGVGLRKGP